MLKIILIFFAMVALGFINSHADEKVNSPLDLTVMSIDGEPVDLKQYKGSVVLIVNTASKCGFTNQYEGLEALYKAFKDSGFVILGFPANNFANQEPGTNNEIKQFCQTEYGVSFPMFAKISVKGKDQHPLYRYLTDKSEHSFGGAIKWNFTKFLINRKGVIVDRFAPVIKPSGEKIKKAIIEQLSAE